MGVKLVHKQDHLVHVDRQHALYTESAVMGEFASAAASAVASSVSHHLHHSVLVSDTTPVLQGIQCLLQLMRSHQSTVTEPAGHTHSCKWGVWLAVSLCMSQSGLVYRCAACWSSLCMGWDGAAVTCVGNLLHVLQIAVTMFRLLGSPSICVAKCKHQVITCACQALEA